MKIIKKIQVELSNRGCDYEKEILIYSLNNSQFFYNGLRLFTDALDRVAQNLDSVWCYKSRSVQLRQDLGHISDILGINNSNAAAVLVQFAQAPECKLSILNCDIEGISFLIYSEALKTMGFLEFDGDDDTTLRLTTTALKSIVLGTDIRFIKKDNPEADIDGNRSDDEEEEVGNGIELLQDPAETGSPRLSPESTEFTDFLPKIAQEHLNSNRMSTNEFLRLVDINLKNPINSSYLEAFDSLDYSNLSEIEKACMLHLCSRIIDSGFLPMSFIGQENGVHLDVVITRRELDQAARRLVSKQLAALVQEYSSNESGHREDRFILSAEVASRLFPADAILDYATISRRADIVKASSIPSKDLFFSDEMMRQINQIKAILEPENSAVLRERLQKIGRKSLTVLFYGASGCGKTELAMQLAKETNRDIIQADVSKLNSKFVGETEANIKELFTCFKYLQKTSSAKTSPILLLNEADALLSSRFKLPESGYEQYENKIQALLLSEIENFEGCMIATTNLKENLDAAMDRRFLLKLNFKKPTADVRERIWAKTLDGYGLSPEDISSLAADYELSGSQIYNVFSRAQIEEFLSGGKVSIGTLREFAESEYASEKSNGMSSARKIGFPTCKDEQ